MNWYAPIALNKFKMKLNSKLTFNNISKNLTIKICSNNNKMRIKTNPSNKNKTLY